MKKKRSERIHTQDKKRKQKKNTTSAITECALEQDAAKSYQRQTAGVRDATESASSDSTET